MSTVLRTFLLTIPLLACGAEAPDEGTPETSTADFDGWADAWPGPGMNVDSGKADFGTNSSVTRPMNGMSQNGMSQNGMSQNGMSQNGKALAMAGADLRTVRMLGTPPAAGNDPATNAPTDAVAGVYLDKGILTQGVVRRPFLTPRPAPRVGMAFKNAIIDAKMGDGTPVKLWLKDIQPTTPADPELLLYVIKVQHPDRYSNPQPGDPCNEFGINCPLKWDYACGTQQVQVASPIGARRTKTIPVPAIAVPGQWNFDQGYPGAGGKMVDGTSPSYTKNVTFACLNGAIGKCAYWGYRPWKQQSDGTTLELEHEACVRMVRADYCGDGQPHTVDGILIDVWDNAGVGTQLPYSVDPAAYNGNPPTGSPFGLEAEWTPNGARCISQLLMPRTSHAGGNLTVQHYLEGRDYCNRKWPAQMPHPWMNPDYHVWSQDGCFGYRWGGGNDGVHTDFDGTGLMANPRDRVYIRNSSVCIDDRVMPYPQPQPNPLKTSAEWAGKCLPGGV